MPAFNAPMRGRGTPQSSGTPAWLSGMSVNEWKEITGTKLSLQPGIDTGVSSGKQDAWCGWHVDPRSSIVYSVGQGGHADYSGNEVNALDLTADAPAWSQVLASSASSAVTFDGEYYSDGKPSAVHGYHTAVFIESLDRCVRMWGGSRATSGNPIVGGIQAFNISTGAYDVSSTWTGSACPEAGLGGNNGAYAKHPTTEDVICWLYNGRISKWAPGLPGTISTLLSSPPNPAPSGTAAAIDPTRGTSTAGVAFFLGGGSGGTMCHKYDLGSPSTNPVAITLTGTDISATSRAGFGLIYVEATDKFYARVSGAAGSLVYEITPTAGTSWACSLLTTSGGGSLTETVGNGAGGASPYTKFLYVPAYGCAVFSPRWGDNVWALKLHEV